MDDLTQDSPDRKELLKHMILQLHRGEAPEEVLKFCDIHTQVLEGHIDPSGARPVPPGHPVDTFKQENRELLKVAGTLNKFYEKINAPNNLDMETYLIQMKALFNNLMDVEKHYQRKENLLFPYLEKYQITGPPKVKFFSHGRNPIFKRSRAVLGRDVRLCHPPKSVAIVKQIISDFKSGRHDKAAFWLEMKGIFVYIEYYALRDEHNKYLGTMEVVQDITELRKIKGEQRLLSYSGN